VAGFRGGPEPRSEPTIRFRLQSPSNLDSVSEYQVRPVASADITEMRAALLWGTDAAETDPSWAADQPSDTLHVGGYRDGRLVGFASIARSRAPGRPEPNAWRILGIGVEHGHRGYGLGGMLMHRCLDHAAARGARLVWCRIPAGAFGFFEHLGFRRHDQPFEAAGTGPHYLMMAAFGPRQL
jgi:GNAT superfamily N-acetyltransferase